MTAAKEITLDLARANDADPGVALLLADRPLTPAEQTQVDQAVRTVNALLLSKNLEIAVELHRYVIDEFFGGQWQAWVANRPGHSPAYDAFANHSRLRLGKEMLREWMRVGEQARQMPGGVASALTVAHHRALLPVPSDGERLQLAERAVQEELNAKQLAELVRQIHPLPPRSRGRPPQHRGFKKVAEAFKATRAVDPALVTAEVGRYTPHQRSVMTERAQAMKAMAEAVLAALGPNG